MARPRKFENRREVILQTAAALFLEKGFEGVTMDGIAKACDLGKATIYAEFASKEDLMDAVIVGYIRQAQLEMKTRFEQAGGDYLTVLREVLMHRLTGMFERVNKHFHNMETLMAARKGASDKIVRQYREEELRILANILEKAAQHGEIAPSENYFHLARLLRKGLAGLYPPHLFNIGREEYEQDARALIDIFLAGLSASRPAAGE